MSLMHRASYIGSKAVHTGRSATIADTIQPLRKAGFLEGGKYLALEYSPKCSLEDLQGSREVRVQET